MKNLHCPWRSTYAQSADDSKQTNASSDECVFCRIIATDIDEKELVIARAKHCIVMMNQYPYNAGHLLIIPYAHTSSLHELKLDVRAELIELTSYSTDVLTQTLGAHGHNVGLNLGKSAGAGIPSHVHMHVLPRWSGDTNFLPTLAGTKQISFDLHEIYKKIKREWKF